MLAWMVYVLFVSLVLGIAALAFEHAARLRKANTRWIWGASIIASLLVPFVMSSVTVQIPLLGAAAPDHPAKALVLRQMTLPEFSPSDWLVGHVSPTVSSAHVDDILRGGWIAASAALLLAIVASGLHLAWCRRSWERQHIAGTAVYVSDDSGPAIVGLFAPRIVVPRWLMVAPLAEQELVLAHEDAHLEAHDAQLLTIALLLLVCMPWNLPLWWQLRRLRFAIEIDCDARVLRRGHAARRYGEVLLAIGERQSTRVAVVAAMSESESFLEQRLRHIFQRPARWAGAMAVASGCLGAALAATASQVSPPNVEAHSRPLHEIPIDTATLDAYTGFYRLGDNAVFQVTRDGDRLVTQATGHRPVPIFARSRTVFYVKESDAQVTFVRDKGGQATSLVSHQGGRDFPMPRMDAASAQRIAARVDDKVRDQTASAGTEAALRRLVDGILNNDPAYGEMTSALATATREQLPKLHAGLSRLGAVKSIVFRGVGTNGDDVYTVNQQTGSSRWRIALDLKGTISTALVSPGP